MRGEPPKLTIASVTDGEMIARRQERAERKKHRQRVEKITRELAANMRDVSRGSGDFKDLPGQVEALWRAIEQSPDEVAYEKVPSAMQAALRDVGE